MKTATAADVHKEFDTTSKSLLHEATRIVGNSNNKSDDLIFKMRELGFGNSVSIKEDAMTIKNAQQILSINIAYPQNNFITEKKIETICKKYGLLMAESRDFIGEIPMKNQMEIANFKMTDEHIKYKVIDRKKFAENIKSINEIKGKREKKPIFSNFWEDASFFVNFFDDIRINSYKNKYFQTISKKDFLAANDSNLSYRHEVKPKFFIVATPDNFNLVGKEIIGEYILVDKDPVVLCKVEGGFLQVSAWGAEANLPEFITPGKN